MPESDDEIAEPNPLIDTIEILLPLRSRKLSRLKRKLMEEKRALVEMERELKKGEDKLILFRQRYKQSLDDFNHHHTGVVLLHEKLHLTLEAEKLTRGRLLRQEEDNHTLTQRIIEQQEIIEAADRDVKACQGEIDKLEYILEEKESL